MYVNETTWPMPWIRASLDLAILGCLVEGPLHGYGIAQRLEERGFGRLKGGSLYPALARLGEQGHVESSWVQGDSGPGRRNYVITDAGRDHLKAGLASWRALTRALDVKEGTDS